MKLQELKNEIAACQDRKASLQERKVKVSEMTQHSEEHRKLLQSDLQRHIDTETVQLMALTMQFNNHPENGALLDPDDMGQIMSTLCNDEYSTDAELVEFLAAETSVPAEKLELIVSLERPKAFTQGINFFIDWSNYGY